MSRRQDPQQEPRRGRARSRRKRRARTKRRGWRPRPTWRIALPALGLAVLLAALATDPALAASSAKQVGKNLGDTLKVWGTALFGGITAVMACKHLLNREVAQGLVFAVMAVLLGLFVFAQTGVGHFIQGLGSDLFG